MKLWQVPGDGIGIFKKDGKIVFVFGGRVRFGKMEFESYASNHMHPPCTGRVGCIREDDELERYWQLSAEDIKKFGPEILRRLKHESI